jgi:hypothetical protein
MTFTYPSGSEIESVTNLNLTAVISATSAISAGDQILVAYGAYENNGVNSTSLTIEVS